MVGANRTLSQTLQRRGVSVDDKIGFLATPESWPGHTRHVIVVQTHHAWLFMTDRHVYKMKKPFRAGGMDFSALESRRQLCLDEYRLNRVLAGHTYLGVVPLVLTESRGLALNVAGTVVEWLVKMRRLPESRMLPVLTGEHRLTDAHMADFVRKLSRFHKRAPECVFEPGAYAAKLRNRLEFWHRELRRCRLGWPELPPGLVAAQHAYLDEHDELLETRQRDGCVRSVHGDLRPEHVFILEDIEPQIIDCLEFDAELRQLDIAAELAHFAMECRHLGLPRLARWCVSEYRRREPASLGRRHLAEFYASVAATVRAGLMAWRVIETGSPEWGERTAAYLGAARHYIERAR